MTLWGHQAQPHLMIAARCIQEIAGRVWFKVNDNGGWSRSDQFGLEVPDWQAAAREVAEGTLALAMVEAQARYSA